MNFVLGFRRQYWKDIDNENFNKNKIKKIGSDYFYFFLWEKFSKVSISINQYIIY